ncbi:hypothetical protein SDC9_188223 [bioreactor metagenome]|uniref:Uncharacterized protein n=1 Tax=bioreactor metagenome TaxID=1076179 RepID=A0A645HNQ5_9ZZZZ
MQQRATGRGLGKDVGVVGVTRFAQLMNRICRICCMHGVLLHVVERVAVGHAVHRRDVRRRPKRENETCAEQRDNPPKHSVEIIRSCFQSASRVRNGLGMR